MLYQWQEPKCELALHVQHLSAVCVCLLHAKSGSVSDSLAQLKQVLAEHRFIILAGQICVA